MKRFLAFGLLLAMAAGLCGCGQWLQEEYRTVSSHVEQPLPTTQEPEVEAPPQVSNRNELRGAVLGLVRDWTEQGTIYVRAYDGDISTDLAETMDYITREDPIGAYAVDYADAELDGTAQEGEIRVRMVFRRSAAEIDAIVTVSGNNSAHSRIQSALASYTPALTLRIKAYQEEDFSAYIRRYCLENPDQVVCVPEISANLYPETGETRILELHFLYPGTREEMRELQDSLNTILSSAASYIRSGQDEREMAGLLSRFLCTRFDYTTTQDEPTMPAYQLLCDGVAHSLSLASVFRYECTSAGLSCYLVSGSRNGVDYYWNMLRIGEAYYFVDLMRAVERGESQLLLYTGDTMEEDGYVWSRGDYPAVVYAAQADPAEESSGPTETVPPTESAPPSESTEPSSTEESIEPSAEGET